MRVPASRKNSPTPQPSVVCLHSNIPLQRRLGYFECFILLVCPWFLHQTAMVSFMVLFLEISELRKRDYEMILILQGKSNILGASSQFHQTVV